METWLIKRLGCLGIIVSFKVKDGNNYNIKLVFPGIPAKSVCKLNKPKTLETMKRAKRVIPFHYTCALNYGRNLEKVDSWLTREDVMEILDQHTYDNRK